MLFVSGQVHGFTTYAKLAWLPGRGGTVTKLLALQHHGIVVVRCGVMGVPLSRTVALRRSTVGIGFWSLAQGGGSKWLLVDR